MDPHSHETDGGARRARRGDGPLEPRARAAPGPNNAGPHNAGPHNAGPHNAGPSSVSPTGSGPGSSDPAEAALLAAALADLAPEAPAAIADAVGAILAALAEVEPAAGARGPSAQGALAGAARAIAAGLVAAGAEGAEVFDLAARRRLAASGPAVPDGARWALGQAQGFPGRVAVVRIGRLAAVLSAGLPGSEVRERLEDCAAALLSLAALDGDPGGDPHDLLGLDGPAGPLPA